MAVKGFQGTSMLDFPRRVASLVFYGGCNLRCPYCHNPGLVEDPNQYPDISTEDVLQQLQQRRGFIDGVVISGGEPTLDPHLAEMLCQIKQLQLQVKLDTNGLRPQVLESLLQEKLLDFVGLDVKTALQRYGELCGELRGDDGVDGAALQRSIALLRDADIEVEFRTTCAPGLVEEDDIHAMGEMLCGGRLWVLQQFVAAPAMDEKMRSSEPHAAQKLHDFADIARQYVDTVQLRGL